MTAFRRENNVKFTAPPINAVLKTPLHRKGSIFKITNLDYYLGYFGWYVNWDAGWTEFSLAGSSSHTFYQQNIHTYMKPKGCVQKALLAYCVLGSIPFKFIF